MGSKSSSSTTKQEFVTTTNKNTSGLEDSQAFTDVGSVSIDTVDDVIVDRAFDFGDSAFTFGRDSLDFAGGGLDAILDFGSDIVENQQIQLTDTLSSINAANATSADLSNTSRQETIQTVAKYAAIGAVVWGVFYVLKKVRK